MKHLEIAFSGTNQWWKYLVVFFAALIAANTIGVIPLVLVVIYKVASATEPVNLDMENLMDLSTLGISSNLTLILMLIPFVVGLAILLILIKAMHKQNWKQTINGTSAVRWRRFFLSGFVWALMMSLYLIVDYQINPQDFTFHFDFSTFLPLLAIVVLLIPIQTTFEEVLFRGYFAQGVGVLTKSRILVVIIPALIFGLMHIMNPEVAAYGFWLAMPQYIFFGLVFGVIAVLDDGIESAMGVHAANNMFAALMITSDASALQTSALFTQMNVDPAKELIALLIGGTLLVVVLGVIYKWNYSLIFSRITSGDQSENDLEQ